MHSDTWILPTATVRVPPDDRLIPLEPGCPRGVQYPRPSNRPGALASNIAHPNSSERPDPFPCPKRTQAIRPSPSASPSASPSPSSFQVLVAAVDTGHTGQDPDRPRQALQAAQSQCTSPPRPPATGPRTLAGCFCAEVLPGASSKPNLPAIKSIIKFDTAKRSPKRLLPSRPSHSPVTALRRQPWLFSLTTYCSAAPRCRILPLTWISIWIDTCIITHHNEGLRLDHLDIR